MKHNRHEGNVVAILQCWDDPKATEDKTKRTRLLVDYIFTDKDNAVHRMEQAKECYPMFGWSITYQWASKDHDIIGLR